MTTFRILLRVALLYYPPAVLWQCCLPLLPLLLLFRLLLVGGPFLQAHI